MTEATPQPGAWPVDPQHDEEIRDERIWIDGCFDFFHHGHAGVMLQASRLGQELYVGLHSDEDILEHKGPTVMNLKERCSAVEACRWATRAIPYVPYVTQLPWISHYGCRYVVHGDDITSDSSGEDCYRFVKQAGRFKVVKRTPGISTTDLVGRMLLCTKSHFIHSLKDTLDGKEGESSKELLAENGREMQHRIREYASDKHGRDPCVEVWFAEGDKEVGPGTGPISFRKAETGYGRVKPQRLVYVDGGFDLFSSGHIEFLRSVARMEEEMAKDGGWYTEYSRRKRLSEYGWDFPPAFIVVGLHDDEVINQHKGLNYPIMNIFERGLCVLQCKYVHAVVFGAPYIPSKTYLEKLPYGKPDVVYHGPTSFMPTETDPYTDAKQLGIFKEVPAHDFQDVDAGQIVGRIMASRALYEERQRKKGVKAVGEEAARQRERDGSAK